MLKLLIALCGPVALIGQGYMLLLLYHSAPVWVSIVVTIALWVTILGIGSLFDKRYPPERY